jgi:hypothetical protein
MTTSVEIKNISIALETAEDHGLLTEVVWSAMHYMKKNPKATLCDAMSNGLLEWVK